jgi:hypothetical protein
MPKRLRLSGTGELQVMWFFNQSYLSIADTGDLKAKQ